MVFFRLPVYRLCCSVLLFGALIVPVTRGTHAQAQKPVLIVSAVGVEQLISEAGYLARIAGLGEMGPLINLMTSPYTQGLGRDLPMGLVLHVEDEAFVPLGVVPVTDLDQLLKILPPRVGTAKKLDEGLIQLEGQAPIFIRQQNGWAFMGQTPDALNKLPDEPLKLLQGLEKQYVFAIRLMPSNIPAAYRQMMMSAVQHGMDARLESAESSAERQLQQRMMQNQLRQLELLIDDTEHLTLGWNSDREHKTVYVDAVLKAGTATRLSRQMALLQDTKTSFGRLLQDTDATIAGNMISRLHPNEVEQYTRTLETLRQAAKKGLEEAGEVPPDARPQVNRVIDGLVDVAQQTLQSGRLDGMFSVSLDTGPIQAFSAGRLQGGRQLESLLKESKELWQLASTPPTIELDVARVGDVGLHLMRIPVPAEPEARRLFGSHVELAIGLSEDHAYSAIGPGAVDRMRVLVETAQDSAPAPFAPFTLTVHLGRLAQYAAPMDPKMQRLARAMRGISADAIRLTATPLDDAARFRMEVEEGIIRALVAARFGDALPAPAVDNPAPAVP